MSGKSSRRSRVVRTSAIKETVADLKKTLEEYWVLFSGNMLGVTGLLMLGIFVIIAVAAPYLAPYGEWEMGVCKPFEPPSSIHLFGCDELGRDLFTLFLYGTRVSLIVGIVAALISTMIGGTIGIVAGYTGGKIDSLLMRITDTFLSIPAIVLMIILAALLGPSFINIIIVIAILTWPPIARIVRSQVLSVKEYPYIEAARAVGAGSLRIMSKHILPNVMPILFANMILQISNAIIAEAALSFLGLGDPHTTSWGMILHYAHVSGAIAAGYWWYVIPPGLGILFLVLSFVLIGYALDEIVNPRLRRA